MNRIATIGVLNRLLRILYRSLPRYVTSSRLWARRDAEEILKAIERVASDQEAQAARLADQIRQRRGYPDAGHFPVAFTALNDLAVPYILKLVVEYQRRDLQAIRSAVDELAGQPDLRSLAEEIVQSAQGHLETLEPLAQGASPAAATR
jgi:bacterioferritin (cytochrome b1)